MRVVYHQRYGRLSLPDHVFPIEKYRLTLQRLLDEGIVRPGDVVAPDPPDWEAFRQVHDADYLEDLRLARLSARTAASELPVRRDLIDDFRLMAGGTLTACRVALEDGGAVHLGGGFHHAMPGHAEGFCYLNDLALALAVLLAEGRVARPAVVDCDLHQGNGTAVTFRDEPRVYTFSIHQREIYPIPKPPSDRDIELPAGTGDERYLELLQEGLEETFQRHRPDFLLYQAGADPFVEDQLGDLRLSRDGLSRRDRLVLEAARARGVPFTVTLGGGYARRVEDTVAIHVETARVAAGLLAVSDPSS